MISPTRNLTPSDWLRLRAAIQRDLPFPPPFQRKDAGRPEPEPRSFEEDVWHHGDYGEGLEPVATIEWIRIRPRFLRPRGRLIPDEVIDCETELKSLLAREGFDWREEAGSIYLFGGGRC